MKTIKRAIRAIKRAYTAIRNGRIMDKAFSQYLRDADHADTDHPCYHCDKSCPGNGSPNFFECADTMAYDDHADGKTEGPLGPEHRRQAWRVLGLAMACYVALC